MINDYATLQQEVASWLARADLTASIPTFIQLAEASFNRELRTRNMLVTVPGSAVGGTFTLPTDLKEVQSLRVACGGVFTELEPLPPAALRAANLLIYPIGYVVQDGAVVLVGSAGTVDYELTYFQAIPALSGSNTQNWLILREPGAYLYGALCESAPFLKEDPRLVTWAAMLKKIIDGIQGEDDRYRYGNAPSMQSGLTCAP